MFEIRKNVMIQSYLDEKSWNQWFLSKTIFSTSGSKKRYFRRFDHKNHFGRETKEGSVKQHGAVETCEVYKTIKFDKVISKYLKIILA